MTAFPKYFGVWVLGLVLLVVLGTMSTLPHDIVEAAGSDDLSPTAQQQLAQVRQATARYHNLDNALADGFVQVTDFIPGMGIHFENTARLVTDFDITQPELLIYTVGTNGVLRLVAVEYEVHDLAPPEGFDGDRDVWQRLGHVAWSLHAWIWLDNPDGIFNDTNPKIP